MTTTTEAQLLRFRRAVDLLGGPRAAAAELGVTERTMTRLFAGASPLHYGFLQDTAAALLRHAEACRRMERLLSPAFAENLTPDQPARPAPRGRWAAMREG